MTGKLSASGEVLIQLERAAMIHFGVPSFGVHLNGYVRATGKISQRVYIYNAIDLSLIHI